MLNEWLLCWVSGLHGVWLGTMVSEWLPWWVNGCYDEWTPWWVTGHHCEWVVAMVNDSTPTPSPPPKNGQWFTLWLFFTRLARRCPLTSPQPTASCSRWTWTMCWSSLVAWSGTRATTSTSSCGWCALQRENTPRTSGWVVFSVYTELGMGEGDSSSMWGHPTPK